MINFPSWSDFGTHDESRFPELWEGCVGAWAPCLGPTGDRLQDLSRANSWGTLTNMDAATDWVISGGRYSLDFDAVNDMVTTNITLTSAMTYSCWFNRRTTGVDGGRIIHGSASTVGYMGFVKSTSITLATSAGFTDFAGFSIANGVWYHFATTRDANNNLRVFLNGSESTSGAQVRSGTFTLTQLGRYATIPGNAIYSWDGQLDDVMIFNRNLSQAEIRTLASGRGVAYERRRRKGYFANQVGPTFNPAWARNSNYIISPVGAA